MARSKKDSSHSNDETPESELVRVFSQRLGDIVLENGKVLKYGEVVKLPLELAKWAEKSFDGLVRIIE
jgi:hypothetical protein